MKRLLIALLICAAGCAHNSAFVEREDTAPNDPPSLPVMFDE